MAVSVSLQHPMAGGPDLRASEGPGSSAPGAVTRLAMGLAQDVGCRVEKRESGCIHTGLLGCRIPSSLFPAWGSPPQDIGTQKAPWIRTSLRKVRSEHRYLVQH